jgi:acetyl-CoA carboxylase carboxyltransferase component
MTTDDSQRPEPWISEDPEDELAQRRRETLRGGGEERIESQHDKGKLTASTTSLAWTRTGLPATPW